MTRFLLLSVLASLVSIGCGSEPEPTPTLVETACVGDPDARDPSAVCARLRVPVDPADPDGDTVDLYVLRIPATAPPADRLGTLVIPSSGPGLGAASNYAAENLIAGLPAGLAPRFDIVAWDERGIGESSPVTCQGAETLLREVGVAPQNDAQVRELTAAAERFARSCEGSGALIRHMRPEDNVADLEALRIALGVERLTLYGASYGSMVAMRYAERYPERVRGAILDGPFDPTLDLERWAREQATARERYIRDFVDWCAEPDSECAFAPDLTTGLHKLWALMELRANLLNSPPNGARPLDLWLSIPLTSGVWDAWAFSLEEARAGRVRDLPTNVYEYAVGIADAGESAFEAWDANGYLAATCGLDRDPSVERLGRLHQDLGGVFADEAAYEYFACSALRNGAGLPASTALRYRGSAPLAVVHATGDSATPREWARAVLEQLGDRGRSLSLDAHAHVVGFIGLPCLDEPLAAYLLDPTAAPTAAVECTP